MDSTFEVLIKVIMSNNPIEKREKFIRQNHAKIAPLLQWLCKNVHKLEIDKHRNAAFDESNQQLIDFSLDCIQIISSSISSLSEIDDGCKKLYETVMNEKEFLEFIHQILLYDNISLIKYLGILINFSQNLKFVDYIVENILKSFPLTKFLEDYEQKLNKSKPDVQLLMIEYLNNLCQSKSIRKQLIDAKMLNSLILLNEYSSSVKTNDQIRLSIMNLIRNCCLDYEYHEKIISNDNLDLLIHLIMPLADNGEQFTDEEIETLPLDLQYLPTDKQREMNPKIRKLIIESIHQLCATKYGRELIRSTNIYLILREYHRWEKDEDLIESLMQLIDVLIKKEDEINVDNLKQIEIPAELLKKFESLDATNENGEETKSLKKNEEN